MNRDNIFVGAISDLKPFVFDEQVAEVFEDMIQRSVPGYEMSLSMIALIARRYARPETNVYDLGCSLGASSLALVAGNSLDDIRLVGVDNAEAMLLSCSKNLEKANLRCEWDLIYEDITDTVVQSASIVVLNFTLQFIPLERRLGLLEKIYTGLVSGGVILISEKIAFENLYIHKSMTKLHEDFKRAHGYSDLEVSQKRAALENVLVPESIADHKSRLMKAGFSRFFPWFQCFNFASLIAFKD